MGTLKLKLDDLAVESFRTTPSGRGTGTVWGYESDEPPFNTVGDIPSCDSCDCASNQATCDTCQGPNCDGPKDPIG
jgi:hypothetical protein